MVLIAAAVRWLLLLGSVLAVAATFLPAWRTDVWWVRYLDYPRLQISALLLAALSLMLVPIYVGATSRGSVGPPLPGWRWPRVGTPGCCRRTWRRWW